MDQLASVQMKKHKLPLESDIKREEMFLKFKQDEVKKNREHKLEMAKIYANAMIHQVSYPVPSSDNNSYLQTPPQALTPSLCLEIPAPQQVMDMVEKHKTTLTNNTPIHYIAQGYNKKGLLNF